MAAREKLACFNFYAGIVANFDLVFVNEISIAFSSYPVSGVCKVASYNKVSTSYKKNAYSLLPVF